MIAPPANHITVKNLCEIEESIHAQLPQQETQDVGFIRDLLGHRRSAGVSSIGVIVQQNGPAGGVRSLHARGHFAGV